MSWSVLLTGGFAAAVVMAFVQVVKAFIGRPLIQASAADRLSDSAIKLIAAATRAADEASRDAEEARQEAAEARREAGDARRSAEEAAREVRALKAAIMEPAATIERLRSLVGEPGNNGTGASARPI